MPGPIERAASLARALRRLLPSLGAGLADAGLAAIAGFAASLYAVRTLEGAELGAFSLYLSAAVVGSLFAQQLIYLPGQIASLEAEREVRPRLLRPLLVTGAGVSLAVAPFVGLSGSVLGSEVGAESLVALGTGAAAIVVLGPMQDHVRSAFYLANRSRLGAAVSGVQLGVTLVALLVLHQSSLASAWVPLWAVAFGAGGSLLAGLLMGRDGGPPTGALPPVRGLVGSGVHLLPTALVQEATIFVANTAVALLASPTALGRAEAARLVARPVQTMSLGVSRVLAPRLMEAGSQHDRTAAGQTGGLYLVAIGLGGLVYLAVAGWEYPGSPFVAIVPAAYVSAGLAGLFALAAALGTMAQIPRGVLLGAGRTRTLLQIGVVGAAVRVGGVVLLAGAIGAYALPVAHLISLAPVGGLTLRAAMRELGEPDGRVG